MPRQDILSLQRVKIMLKCRQQRFTKYYGQRTTINVSAIAQTEVGVKRVPFFNTGGGKNENCGAPAQPRIKKSIYRNVLSGGKNVLGSELTLFEDIHWHLNISGE